MRAASCPPSRAARTAGKPPTKTFSGCMSFYATGRAGRELREGHPAGAAADARERRSSRCAWSAIPRTRQPGSVYPLQQPRPGVAAVVFLVEQPSRTTSCCASQRRASCEHRSCCVSRSDACSPIPKVTGARDQLRRTVALPAQPEEHAAAIDRVPGLRRQPAPAFEQEAELFFASIMRENRSVLDLMTPTTRSSTSGSRSTTTFPASTAATSAA